MFPLRRRIQSKRYPSRIDSCHSDKRKLTADTYVLYHLILGVPGSAQAAGGIGGGRHGGGFAGGGGVGGDVYGGGLGDAGAGV